MALSGGELKMHFNQSVTNHNLVQFLALQSQSIARIESARSIKKSIGKVGNDLGRKQDPDLVPTGPEGNQPSIP